MFSPYRWLVLRSKALSQLNQGIDVIVPVSEARELGWGGEKEGGKNKRKKENTTWWRDNDMLISDGVGPLLK
jgi:hypothetical protein